MSGDTPQRIRGRISGSRRFKVRRRRVIHNGFGSMSMRAGPRSFVTARSSGTTPLDIDVAAGDKPNVTLRRDGFEDKTVQIEPASGKKVLTFSLKPRVAVRISYLMQETRQFTLDSESKSERMPPRCRRTRAASATRMRTAAAMSVPRDAETLASRGRLTIVADGMGGHASGEVASHMAVEIISEIYYSDRSLEPAGRPS